MTTWIDQAELTAMAQRQSGLEILRELYPAERVAHVEKLEFVPVEEGLFCSLNAWKTAEPTTDHTVVRNSIGLQFVQAGSVRQTLAGHGRYLHAGARVCLTTFPKETRQVRRYGAGLDVKYIGAWVAPDLLVDKFGLEVEALPAPLAAFFRGETSQPFCMSLPLPPRLWLALDEVFASGFSGKLRQTYLATKMTELVCELTASLGRAPAPGAGASGQAELSPREQLLIETAAMIYMRELAAPPSVEALAARIGLNRNRLSEGFRQVFGCTPHDYSKRQRMDWARRLILDGTMRLGEVAQAAGYASLSSFSRAFTDHFGFPPSAAPSAATAE